MRIMRWSLAPATRGQVKAAEMPWENSERGAAPEDGGPDAHVRCAESDGGLVVVAHAHAQGVEAVRGSELGEEGEVNRRFLVDGRDAHEAGDLEPQVIAAERCECRQLVR